MTKYRENHKEKCPNVEEHGDLCKDCIDLVEKQGVAYDSRNEQ